MMLGMWQPYFDDAGNVIYFYDDATGEYMDAAGDPLGVGTAPADIGKQGYGFTKPDVINYAGYVPPSDPIAAGLDPNKLISVMGTVYQYKKTTGPGGTVSYAPVPYTGSSIAGLFSSPWGIAAIAGLFFLAMPETKRGK